MAGRMAHPHPRPGHALRVDLPSGGRIVPARIWTGGRAAEDAAGADVSKDKFYQVGAVVPVTQAGSVHAAFGQVKTSFPVGADAKERQFSLAYHHTLSKRTGVYAGVTYSKYEEQGFADIKTTTIGAGLRHAF